VTRVGFEPTTTLVFERTKMVHALDSAGTEIGTTNFTLINIVKADIPRVNHNLYRINNPNYEYFH
jgi:hypothetical protein